MNEEIAKCCLVQWNPLYENRVWLNILNVLQTSQQDDGAGSGGGLLLKTAARKLVTLSEAATLSFDALRLLRMTSRG